MTLKRVLITGAGGTIGTHLSKYLNENKSRFSVTHLNLRETSWPNVMTSEFDTVVHLAGIAHKKKTSKQEFQRVNCDLAYEVASYARDIGIQSFIFSSTMAVYGLDGTLNRQTTIDYQTPILPQSPYGETKWLAERMIARLNNENAFRVSILRPPMVYGPDCKGNYNLLQKLSAVCPLWPAVHNQRSAIYIDLLIKFIVTLIEQPTSGVFFPQDPSYMDTQEIIKQARTRLGKNTFFSRRLAQLLPFLAYFSSTPIKAFGNLCYSQQLTKTHLPEASYNSQKLD